jgi:hypothetical protein
MHEPSIPSLYKAAASAASVQSKTCIQAIVPAPTSKATTPSQSVPNATARCVLQRLAYTVNAAAATTTRCTTQRPVSTNAAAA